MITKEQAEQLGLVSFEDIKLECREQHCGAILPLPDNGVAFCPRCKSPNVTIRKERK